MKYLEKLRKIPEEFEYCVNNNENQFAENKLGVLFLNNYSQFYSFVNYYEDFLELGQNSQEKYLFLPKINLNKKYMKSHGWLISVLLCVFAVIPLTTIGRHEFMSVPFIIKNGLVLLLILLAIVNLIIYIKKNKK